MEKKFELSPPGMPNFISVDIGTTVRRQDDFDPRRNIIPVASLTEEEAVEYGELIKQTFIRHWKNKRAQK